MDKANPTPFASHTRFRYEPFTTANEIRLLRIPRGTAEAPGNVDYTLFHVCLGDNIEYTALSYCWGDPTATEQISVNGRPLRITRSLATALSSIRDENADIILWADAICVNQKDLDERTAQVQLMRQVYKTAQLVLVWLGPSTPDTDRTMQETRKLGSKLVEAGLWDLNYVGLNELVRMTARDSDAVHSEQSMQSIITIANDFVYQIDIGENTIRWFASDVWQRPWWTRTWCIQELSNAREAVFRCGSEEVDFKSVWAFKTLFSITSVRVASHIDFIVAKSQTILRRLIDVRYDTLVYGGQGLCNLLHQCNFTDNLNDQSLGVTDPRDRVYALLGIAIDTVANDIVPDYNLPCEVAYVTVARALLKHGHWEVLSLCRKRNICTNLPSWTPDWSAPNQKPWSRWLMNESFDASLVDDTDATDDTFDGFCDLVLPSESDLFRLMFLKAAFVDVVMEVGDINPGKFDILAMGQYLEDIRMYLSRSMKYSASQKENAQWRLPIGDTDMNLRTFEYERASDDSIMRTGYGGFRSPIKEVDERDVVHYNDFAPAYLSQMNDWHDSRPFISKTGHVGICSMETQPGDSVVIIMGANLPYVLRKGASTDSWTLVGESHVYGIMDGEFMRQDPKPTIVDITLH